MDAVWFVLLLKAVIYIQNLVLPNTFENKEWPTVVVLFFSVVVLIVPLLSNP